MTPRSWLTLALVLTALAFALQAGEYSTLQWRELRRAEKVEVAEVARLRREVDSLEAYLKLVRNDSVTQERIAREQYGMLRRGEHQFILEAAPEREP